MSQFKCGADVVSVIREEEANATKFISRDISDYGKKSEVLSKIKEGKKIYPQENVDRVEIRSSMPAAVQFDDLNLDQKGYEDVSVEYRDNCSTTRQRGMVLGNKTDDLACEDECVIEIQQGFKEDNHYDYGKSFGTEVFCTKKVWHLPADRVHEYWKTKLSTFSKFLAWNKEQNFMSYAIRFGGANSSAVDGIMNSDKLFTRGDFIAEPDCGLSVGHLMAYRDRMIASGGLDYGELLEFSAPKRDIIAAIKDHTQKTNPNAQINISFNEETGEGFLMGKEYIKYETIKFVVNEMPCKGYFKGGMFNPVYPWKSGAEGFVGRADDWNEQYYNSHFYCEGKYYPMVNLGFFINPMAMTHHAFHAPINPVDSSAEMNNVARIITGNAYSLGCNDDNDKFKLRSRLAGRFAFGDTQWMGAIAYLAESAQGSMRKIEVRPKSQVCENPVYPPQFEQCDGTTDCGKAICESCDKTPEGSTCVDSANAEGGFVNLEEKSVETFYDGETRELTLRIKRSGGISEQGSVDYAFADGTAENGTHYTGVDGTALFEARSSQDYLVKIPIIGSVDPSADFKLIISNASGGLTLGECIESTVTIYDATSNCLEGDCDKEPVAPVTP